MTRLRCILVDDEKEALDRLEQLLNHFNFVEISAKINTVEGVVESILNLRPQLVFMDVEMPAKTGFDLVQEVRSHGLNPTFIFVTGYDQYAIKAIRHAAFDFLVKPVDIDELKEALERFCKEKELYRCFEIPAPFIKKYALTTREVEVLELLRKNKSSREIAETLFISKHTVDTHRRSILKKTNHKSTLELLYALTSGK